jgi:hypothetical protein
MSNNIVTNDEIYDVIKTTMNVKLFESINKHLDALALKLFLGIAIPSLVITIMLIYLFQLNLKKLLITNMIILSTTILAELIFVFVFTKNLTILDNTSLQLIIQKSIADYYKQSFDYYYSTICNQQII